MSTSDDLSRRDVLKLTAGAVVASQVTVLGAAVAGTGHKFFTDPEYALVDELSDILIPADDHRSFRFHIDNMEPGERFGAAFGVVASQKGDAQITGYRALDPGLPIGYITGTSTIDFVRRVREIGADSGAIYPGGEDGRYELKV